MKAVVFIIPTGIGCAIGGHAGDATPAAKLIAQTCDKLILHPNVVNASDINEMPANALYVEGSLLDSFLERDIDLQEVASNRVLVVANKPILPITMNAISAAAATIGMNVSILALDTPLKMYGWVKDSVAGGRSSGVKELIKQVKNLRFDALAIATPIKVKDGIALDYFKNSKSRVNPWGAIEAKVSRAIATALDKPVAHAPVEEFKPSKNPKITELERVPFDTVVEIRKSAEVISNCFIHCILKGLHTAPRICYREGRGIGLEDVIAMVSPYGCIGRPHHACLKMEIPIIAVRENTTAFEEEDDRIIYVDNYLEAAGVINCINAGITPISTTNLSGYWHSWTPEEEYWELRYDCKAVRLAAA